MNIEQRKNVVISFLSEIKNSIPGEVPLRLASLDVSCLESPLVAGFPMGREICKFKTGSLLDSGQPKQIKNRNTETETIRV